MSSTRLLRNFFKRYIIPTAKCLDDRNVNFIQLIPDESPTWYEPGPTGPAFTEYRLCELQTRLEQMWNVKEFNELNALAKPVSQLALKLNKNRRVNSEKLADSTYMMY